MKVIFYIISLTFYLGCFFNSNSNFDFIPIELTYKDSFYRNDKNKIEFVRIVEDSSILRKVQGNIAYDSLFRIKQEINVDTIISMASFQNIRRELIKNGFRTKLDEKRKVLFLQIKPESNNMFELLNFRHKTENELDKLLKQNNIGEFIAGDLGPGGANILFEVDDWDKSFNLILSYLNSRKILQNSMITRRLYTADEDWIYEIVYPVNYNGIFNQM